MSISEAPRSVPSKASSQDELAASLLVTKQELEVDKLFKACVKLEGSDLHLKVGTPPIVRVKGDLKPLNRAPIEIEEMVRLLIPMLDDRNRRIFEEEGGADGVDSIARGCS
jgi:twitching motility protein PilT